MRLDFSLLAAAFAVATLTGCAGPENKLGRGMSNMGEIIRGGEMRRSIEQTGLWEGAGAARTTGFLRGFNRTMARTGIGLYEVATFPIPPYKPVLTPKQGIYPDYAVRTTKFPYGGLKLPEQAGYPASYKPGLPANMLFETDSVIGFSGGEIAPLVPGSRFRIFNNN